MSATQFEAQIAAGDVAQAGVANLAVVNPAPGGGGSNAAAFFVRWQTWLP